MNKKVLIGLAAVIIVGLLAAAGIIIYDKIAEKYRESDVKTELSAYYNVPEGEAMIIFDEKVYDKNAIYENGEYYLDFPTVSEKYSTLLRIGKPAWKRTFKRFCNHDRTDMRGIFQTSRYPRRCYICNISSYK